MNSVSEDDAASPGEPVDEPHRTACEDKPGGAFRADWFRSADLIKPIGEQLADQIRAVNREQISVITQPVIDAQRARMDAVLAPLLVTERARTESMLRPLIDAEGTRLDALMAPLRLLGQNQLEQILQPAFEPLMKSLRVPAVDFSPLFEQVAAASAVSFERLRTFEEIPEVDELTIEDLLESEKLPAAVSDFMQSAPVSVLIEDVDPESITHEDAERARVAASESMADTSASTGIPIRQLITYCAAVHLLVTASVLAFYGYDVGAVSDVVAWPLTALAVGECFRRRGE